MLKLIKQLLTFFGILFFLSCTVNNNVTAENETWLITFEKAGCLDVCQSYTISIENDGKFRYKGNFKVKHLETKTGILNSTELSEVNKLVHTINWKEIESSYGNNANGVQLKVMTYNTNTIKKKITYYSSEPQAMKDLEHYIDTIIDKDEL